MTELQYAAQVISLSVLGQTADLDIDVEQLRTLEYLLEEALTNVRRAMPASNPDYAPTEDAPF